MEKIIPCPTCESQFTFVEYLKHAPSCVYRVSVEYNIVQQHCACYSYQINTDESQPINPAKRSAIATNHIESQLESLGLDVLRVVFQHVSIRDLLHLCTVNKKISIAANDEFVWERVCSTEFPLVSFDKIANCKKSFMYFRRETKWLPSTPHWGTPVTFENNNKKLTFNYATLAGALLNVPLLPSKLYRWAVRINWWPDVFAKDVFRMVGVATWEVEIADFGLDQCSWALTDGGGLLHNRVKKWPTIDTGFAPLQPLHFWFKDGKLGVIIGEENAGIIFDNIPCNDKSLYVYPAVLLCSDHDSVELLYFFEEGE